MTRNAGSVMISGPTRTSEKESRKTKVIQDTTLQTKHKQTRFCLHPYEIAKDTSLFNEGDGRLQVLSHAEVEHDAGEPPPAGDRQTGGGRIIE